MKIPEENVTTSDGRIQKFSKTWPAFLILVIALLITIFGWKMARDQVETKLQSLFETENALIRNRISSAFLQQGEVLRSLQSLYTRNIQVVRDVFELFAAVPKSMYPGIRSISYAPRIIEKNRSSFIAYARNEGYTNFTIAPDGIRSEYFPTEYIVPFEENRSEIGHDLYSDILIRNTIQRACEKDEILATPLLSSADNKSSIILLAPVFVNTKQKATSEQRLDAFQGVCSIALNTKEFIQSALNDLSDSSLVSIEIYDSPDIEKASIIYTQDIQGTPIKKSKQKLEIAGRPWTMLFSTRPIFGKTINTSYPWIVLLGGSIISILLFGFIFTLITSKSHAVDLAERITRSQRRIVDSSQDMISVLGFDDLWMNMNQASEQILGYAPSEMIGQKHDAFVVLPDRDAVLQTVHNAKDEVPVSFEARYQHKDGSLRWVNWSVTSSKKDQRIYMIGRDITGKKKSEIEIKLKNHQLDVASMVADQENIKKETSIRGQSQEFRTQLMSILGFLDLILTDQSISREDEREFLTIVNDSAKTMFNSMERLLEVSYSKAKDISFDIQKTNMHYFLLELHQDLNNLSCSELINVSSEIPDLSRLFIYTDGKKLKGSITTLLNTLNHHIPDPHFNLIFKTDMIRESCAFEITVMSKNKIPDHLFFDTEDGSGRFPDQIDIKFNLNLTRAFIEAMGGLIHSQPIPEGMKIEIQFPLSI